MRHGWPPRWKPASSVRRLSRSIARRASSGRSCPTERANWVCAHHYFSPDNSWPGSARSFRAIEGAWSASCRGERRGRAAVSAAGPRRVAIATLSSGSVRRARSDLLLTRLRHRPGLAARRPEGRVIGRPAGPLGGERAVEFDVAPGRQARGDVLVAKLTRREAHHPGERGAARDDG